MLKIYQEVILKLFWYLVWFWKMSWELFSLFWMQDKYTKFDSAFFFSPNKNMSVLMILITHRLIYMTGTNILVTSLYWAMFSLFYLFLTLWVDFENVAMINNSFKNLSQLKKKVWYFGFCVMYGTNWLKIWRIKDTIFYSVETIIPKQFIKSIEDEKMQSKINWWWNG